MQTRNSCSECTIWTYCCCWCWLAGWVLLLFLFRCFIFFALSSSASTGEARVCSVRASKRIPLFTSIYIFIPFTLAGVCEVLALVVCLMVAAARANCHRMRFFSHSSRPFVWAMGVSDDITVAIQMERSYTLSEMMFARLFWIHISVALPFVSFLPPPPP